MTEADYLRRERECIRQFDGKMTQAEAERQTAVELGPRAVEAPVNVAHPGPLQVRLF